VQRTFFSAKTFTEKLLTITLIFTVLTLFISIGVCSLIDYWNIGSNWIIGANWNINNNIPIPPVTPSTLPPKLSIFFTIIGFIVILSLIFTVYQVIIDEKIKPIQKILTISLITFIIAYIFIYAIIALFS
jgi:hypothetical protein